MTITNDKNWMIWKNSYRKTALWPSCFSAFFSALILFPTFWAFGRVTMNIQGKKKKASERDRTDAKKRPWNRFAWYQGEERPVDGVTRFLKEFDRLNNLKTVWHGRTLEQAWGLGICCPYPYVTLFNILLFTDIFEKIIIRCWVYLENIIRKRKMKHPWNKLHDIRERKDQPSMWHGSWKSLIK